MSFTKVQSTSATGTATSKTISFASATTAGNLLVVSFLIFKAGGGGSWAGSVTDGTNTYTQAASMEAQANFQTYVTETYYVANAASISSITVNNSSGSGNVIMVAIHEFSGAATSSVLDVQNSTSGSTAGTSSISLTTTNANELLYGVTFQNPANAQTAGTGFTLDEQIGQTNGELSTEHKVATSSGANTVTWTNSSPTFFVAAAAAFNPSSSANGSVTLTGQSSTTALGSLVEAADANFTLVGQASTSAIGTPALSANANVALVGIQITSSLGALSASSGTPATVNLTGIASTVFIGTLVTTADANAPPTGAAATFSIGTGLWARGGDLVRQFQPPGSTGFDGIASYGNFTGGGTFPTTRPGSLLIVTVSGGGDLSPTLSDSSGNTYIQGPTQTISDGFGNATGVRIFYCENATPTSNLVISEVSSSGEWVFKEILAIPGNSAPRIENQPVVHSSGGSGLTLTTSFIPWNGVTTTPQEAVYMAVVGIGGLPVETTVGGDLDPTPYQSYNFSPPAYEDYAVVVDEGFLLSNGSPGPPQRAFNYNFNAKSWPQGAAALVINRQPDGIVLLTGLQINSAINNVQPHSANVSLNGLQTTSSLGALVAGVSASVNLTGLQINSALGTVQVNVTDATVFLTGLKITSFLNAPAQLTQVAFDQATSATNTFSKSYASPVRVGDLLIASVGYERTGGSGLEATTRTLSDSLGNTWIEAIHGFNTPDGLSVWYSIASHAGTPTVSTVMDASLTTYEVGIALSAFSGSNWVGTDGTETSANALGAFTTSTADLVFAAALGGSSTTPGNGFIVVNPSSIPQFLFYADEFLMQSVAGVVQPAFSPTGANILAAVAFSRGSAFTPTGNANVNLVGVSATFTAGSAVVSVPANVNLTGISSTSSIGTVVASGGANTTPPGQSITSSIGTLTESAGATFALTGLAITGALGSLAASNDSSFVLTGLQVNSALGTLNTNGTANVSLTGIAITSGRGVVIASTASRQDANFNLAGIQINSSLGAVSALTYTTNSATARTGAQDLSPNGGSWTNPGNVISNSSFVTIVLGTAAAQLSDVLKATNFGFAVPALAEIHGISIAFARFCSASGIQANMQVQLTYQGAPLGTLRSLAFDANGNISTDTDHLVWPTSTTDVVRGDSNSDPWGATLTPAVVNDPTFGFSVVASDLNGSDVSNTFSVDNFRMTVGYGISAKVFLAGLAINSSLNPATASAFAGFPLTGFGLVSSIGTPVATGNANVNLTGLQINTAIGQFSLSSTVPLTGISIVSSLGTIATLADGNAAISAPSVATAIGAVGGIADGNLAMVGVASVSSLGGIFASASNAFLKGLSMTASVGSVTATGGAAAFLVGVQSICIEGALGLIVPAAIRLTGVSASFLTGTIRVVTRRKAAFIVIG